MADVILGPVSLERMVRAVEKVRERLLRTAAILETAQVPYAVIGGNAVAAWVSRVDEAAVRNTRDVDILLRRADFDAAKVAMAAGGFVYRHAASIDMFLDGPGASARRGSRHLRQRESQAGRRGAGTGRDRERTGRLVPRGFARGGTVRMKLIANRDKDRTHLRDFIEVGLIDATWPAKFPPELARGFRASSTRPAADRDSPARYTGGEPVPQSRRTNHVAVRARLTRTRHARAPRSTHPDARRQQGRTRAGSGRDRTGGGRLRRTPRPTRNW